MKKRKDTGNIAASVKARLTDIARNNNTDLNAVMRQYFQERFLYRLSRSVYAEHFILKGALLFLAYDINRNRLTKDIDFLGVHVDNDTAVLRQIFGEIAAIDYPDGTSFDADTMKAEVITAQSEYEGVRLQMQCHLGTMKSWIQLDVGFGDRIVAGPNTVNYPVLLDFDSPVLYVYSVESAIAEKFEAIVSLSYASSRMKDYYDILYFASNHSCKSEILSQALSVTFQQRGTTLDDYHNIFSPEFRRNTELQVMWSAFINKRGLSANDNFSHTLEKIETFLIGCLTDKTPGLIWNPRSFQWEKER